MPYCAVSGCTNHNKKNAEVVPSERVSFYKFPSAEPFRRKWVNFCGRKDPIRLLHATICSDHFTPEDRRDSLKNRLLGYSPKAERKLKDDAVPSQNGPKTTELSLAKRKAAEERSRRSVKRANHLLAMSLLERASQETTINNNREPGPVEQRVMIIDRSEVGRQHFDGRATQETTINNNRESGPVEQRVMIIDRSEVGRQHFDGRATQETTISSNREPGPVEQEVSREVKIDRSEVGRQDFDGSLATDRKGYITVIVEELDMSEVRNQMTVCRDGRPPVVESQDSRPALTARIAELEAQIETLKAENAKMKEDIGVLSRRFRLSEAEKNKLTDTLGSLFPEGILRRIVNPERNFHWGSEDIRYALAIYRLSSKCYKFLRSSLNYPFPSVSALKEWAAKNRHSSEGFQGVPVPADELSS